jgi:ABC-type Fe3+/spermidine/putrescine transport system ATPase subunit
VGKFDPEEYKAKEDLSFLKGFLDNKLSGKDNELPIRIRRLIKIVKVVLDQPRLLLLDQKALLIKGVDYVEMFELVSRLLPTSSIFMIMSTFEDLLLLERAIVLRHGQIAEMGYIDDLIKNPKSHLSSIIQISDYKDWDDLYKKVTGKSIKDYYKMKEERQKEIKAENKRMKERKQRMEKLKQMKKKFDGLVTDVNSKEGNEWSLRNVAQKLDEHLEESREPSSFFPNTTPESTITNKC